MGQKCARKDCKAWAIKGGTICSAHGGRAPKVKAKAAVRAEVMSWGLGHTSVDPGEVLLRLVTQSAARAERYAQELKDLVTESPSLRDALVAEQWAATEDGELYKRGEYIRGLAVLEAQERDRAANFAAKAVAAGLMKRQVELAEAQAALMAKAIRTILERLDLSPEQRQLSATVVREELLALSA